MIERGGLIVSCQARADNPLHGPNFMAAMALAAEAGGAVALRANGAADIAAIRAVTDLPVIGLNKLFDHDPVYITPTFAAAEAVLAAGAQIVAIDMTFRARKGDDPREIVRFIKERKGRVCADISTVAEGVAAEEAGVHFIATTLSGYTEETAHLKGLGPDFDLIRALKSAVSRPILAEGRFNTPELAREALSAGAHAVVVGTMITNPREITRGFVRGMAPQKD